MFIFGSQNLNHHKFFKKDLNFFSIVAKIVFFKFFFVILTILFCDLTFKMFMKSHLPNFKILAL